MNYAMQVTLLREERLKDADYAELNARLQ